MTIDQIRRARADLEEDMLDMINKRLRLFMAETGLSPSSISVHMLRVDRVGECEPEYCVTAVRAEVLL